MSINIYQILYKAYNSIMQLSGFNYQIQRYINKNINFNRVDSILEVGCGTGITGLSLLQLYPNSHLLLTDINPELLIKLRHKTSDNSNILLGLSDISQPNKIQTLKGEERTLENESFDIICAGANIGYSDNPDKTISDLYQVLKPGGIIIDLEMGLNFWGKVISNLYDYPNVTYEKINQAIGEQGAIISVKKVSWCYFPLNLTRVFITIKKPLT